MRVVQKAQNVETKKTTTPTHTEYEMREAVARDEGMHSHATA